MVLANDGNFHGTTAGYSYITPAVTPNGTIYQLTPAGGVTTIYRFTGGSDGAYPDTPLIQGSDGRLYGVDDYYVPQQGPGAYRETSTFFAVTTGGVFSILATVPAGTVTGLIQASDGNFYGTTRYFGADNVGSVFELTRDGTFTTLYSFAPGAEGFAGLATLIEGSDGGLYGATFGAMSTGDGTIFRLTFEAAPSAFFTGEESVGANLYYLGFADGHYFGNYTFFADPHFFYHFDLGYESVLDANDGHSGVYLYDFASNTFFYTSPTLPFPYLYDFSLKTSVYYFPDPKNAGHYNTNGIRYFYRFDTGQIFVK